MHAEATSSPRLRVRLTGIVQGVGMRPHVFAIAERWGLAGFVLNDAEGVLVEVEGADAKKLLEDLLRAPPPLARIDSVEVSELPASGAEGFSIVESAHGARAATGIPADVATCDACLAEVFDPHQRRYRYPFTNCTHCGPRFTITHAVPYDRPQTSMATFAMCPECAREYRDPRDRRFHAQPIACPACGPSLSTPIDVIVEKLRAGEIVALKGLGGYHLVCDATSADAVAKLRARKKRDAKPFALMVANAASAERITHVDAKERALLESRTRPIVLLRRRDDVLLPDDLAPGLAWLGVMLPYTPLHHLLFHEAAGRPSGSTWLEAPQELVLVATSANTSGEPLVIDDEDAKVRLAPIADHVVSHDRPILVRADDGVERVIGDHTVVIRRARGHAPEGLSLPRVLPPILAVGAELKNTFTMTRGREAFVSPHLGDLDDPETRRAWDASLAHFLAILDTRPEAVAHDLHPDFFSTRRARELGLPTIAVQHHHAHVASVLAEHGVDRPVLGLAIDGYGFGTDGGAWGGELLCVEGARCDRLGHLRPLAQPGADRAAREPWRMAAAALHALGRTDELPRRFGHLAPIATLVDMLERRLRAPETSSLGRWFDAAAGLTGVSTHQRYEGEAAMRFESLVVAPKVLDDGFAIDAANTLDLLPLLAKIADLSCGTGAAREAAELFHGTVAAALAAWVIGAARAQRLDEVVITGGCALNRTLVEALESRIHAAGLRVLRARQLPPNDGGLSLGQAWVAAHVLGVPTTKG